MSEKEDRIIQLLEQIRDHQIQSAKYAEECATQAKKQSEDYTASLARHQESQEVYDQTNLLYKKKLRRAGLAFNFFLLVIAVSAVLLVLIQLAKLTGG